MKRKLLAFMTAMIAAFLVLAACQAAQKPADTGKCFMWKVTSKTGTCYMLGTTHFAPEAMYPLDGAIEQGYRVSEKVVMEISMSMVRQMEAAALALQRGMYPGTETAADHLSPETLDKLEAYLAARGASLDAVTKMRPWLIAVTLVTLEYARLGYDANLGIDKHFYDKASAEGKPVLELESVDYQMSVFAELAPDVQEQFLLETLDSMSKTAAFMESMIQAWRAGDPVALEMAMKEDMTENPKLKPMEKKLLAERNKSMLAKIERLLENDRSYFVMIGAGHLVGDEGIIASLEAKGYKVEQAEKEAAKAAAPGGI